ncbi:heparin lyase I family protein [Streptomyces sp. BE20]|uniref:heparin lyase I family protein n=1 Tax=unclassified Streptomyces TaxID=2593676 RepID=UPI002E7885E4|nr:MULTISPECIES: heparin lyase I family protein [unclassified Streptomyces]MED7948856.1 heparin lyase I family protein [Streptomyces sp. BE303]MEE1822966.1 heparin lyase I family protein [Streptomyces sp. BE20]
MKSQPPYEDRSVHHSSPLPTRPVRLLAAGTAALVLAVPAAAPAHAADSRSWDFESSQKLPYLALLGTSTIAVGPAPGGKGGNAARVHVPADGKSFKSELVIKDLDAGGHRFTFANYLPAENWRNQPVGTIVAQWFSMQSDTAQIKPVVSLMAHESGQWWLKVHWMVGNEVQETILPLGAMLLDHWNRWSFDITWSTPGSPGSIVAMRDGVKVGSYQGANNYHRGEAPHFRVGAYRPAWRPENSSGPAGGAGVLLFVDDITINSTNGTAPNAGTPGAAGTTGAGTAAGGATRPAPTGAGAASPSAPASVSPSTRAGTPSAPAASPSAPASPSTPAATPSASVSPSTPAGTPSAPSPTEGLAIGASGVSPVDDTPVVELQQEDAKPIASDPSGSPMGAILATGGAAVLVGFFLVRRRRTLRAHRGAHRSDG